MITVEKDDTRQVWVGNIEILSTETYNLGSMFTDENFVDWCCIGHKDGKSILRNIRHILGENKITPLNLYTYNIHRP